MERVGDPTRGVIVQPGTVIELPEVWADRYIAKGSAQLVEETKPEKVEEPKPKPAAAPKSKKKK